MFEVEGGPDWIASDRFDIAATAPEGTPPHQVRLMLRALLAERFRLRTHSGKRERSVYAMTVVRDGRLGPNVRRSTTDCTQAPPVAAGPFDRNNPPCWVMRPSPDSDFKSGYARMMFRGMTMDGWHGSGRRLCCEWSSIGPASMATSTASSIRLRISARLRRRPVCRIRSTARRSRLRSRCSEQLGLKMESTRAPIDVLIIDGAGRPAVDP
jgi:hypothetical protein